MPELLEEPVGVAEVPVQTGARHDRAELRRLALATLFPGFVGTVEPPTWLGQLVEEGLGGVVLFGRNVDARAGDVGVRALTAQLRSRRADLLVAIDEEGGDVTRLDAATGSPMPGSAALGAVDDPDLTYEVAAALGDRLRACGIDLNFAPVADVDVDPLNPIVGVRAFGADADRVARHVAAFVEGQQSRRVAATVKHFPGHGATDEDSHLTVPTVSASRELLEARELVPFRAAVQAGVRAVMTAHILVPALDPAGPATLSPAVVTGVLREHLGYDGAVFTDGLDMHAISKTLGHTEGAIRALLAGVDGLCVGGETTTPETLEAIVAAIVTAVEQGRLPYARLAAAAERILGLSVWAREQDAAVAPVLPGAEGRPGNRGDGAGASRPDVIDAGARREVVDADGSREGVDAGARLEVVDADGSREGVDAGARREVVDADGSREGVDAGARLEVVAADGSRDGIDAGADRDRTRALGAWARAAHRAVQAHGDVALTSAPLVLELQDQPSIAAGAVPWGVGRPLAARLPGTTVVAVSGDDADPTAVLAAHPNRPVVVAVRGARRRAWQADVVAAVRALRPDVVVVDHELPSSPEVLGGRYVLAYGAALGTAEAAADRLTGSGPRAATER